MREFKVFTDGSAVVRGANKGKGGYGVYFPDFYGNPLGLHEGFKNTKTGRMEIMALLTAIETFHINRQESLFRFSIRCKIIYRRKIRKMDL